MPRGDRTGPNGMGPTTGRAAVGTRRGFGGRWHAAPAAPENRKAILQSEVDALENSIEYLKREIDAVDREKDDPQT